MAISKTINKNTPNATTITLDNDQQQHDEQEQKRRQKQLELIQYVVRCQQDPECDVVPFIPEETSSYQHHHHQSSSTTNEESKHEKQHQHPTPDIKPNTGLNTTGATNNEDRVIQNTTTISKTVAVNPSTNTDTNYKDNNHDDDDDEDDDLSESYHVVFDPFLESISHFGDNLVHDCDILIMESCCWFNSNNNNSNKDPSIQNQYQQQQVHGNDLLSSCPKSPVSPTRSTTTRSSISIQLHQQSPTNNENHNHHYVTDDDDDEDVGMLPPMRPVHQSSSFYHHPDDSNFGLYNTTIIINHEDDCSIFSRHTTTPDDHHHYPNSFVVRSSDDSISSNQSVQTIPLSSCHDKSYSRYDAISTGSYMDGYSAGSSKEPGDDEDDDDNSFSMGSILLRLKIDNNKEPTATVVGPDTSSINVTPVSSDNSNQYRSGTVSLNSNSSSVDSFILSKRNNRHKNHTSPTSIIQWLSLKDSTNTINQLRINDINDDINGSYPLYPKKESNPSSYNMPAPQMQLQQSSSPLEASSAKFIPTRNNTIPKHEQPYDEQQEQQQHSPINNNFIVNYNTNSEIENHYRWNSNNFPMGNYNCNKLQYKYQQQYVHDEPYYRSLSYDRSSSSTIAVIDNRNNGIGLNDPVQYTMTEANLITIPIPPPSSSSNHTIGAACLSTTSSLTGDVTDGSSIFDFSSLDNDDDLYDNNEFKIDSVPITDPTNNPNNLNLAESLSMNLNNTLENEYMTIATPASFGKKPESKNNTYEDEDDDDENNCLLGLCFITDDATITKVVCNTKGSNGIIDSKKKPDNVPDKNEQPKSAIHGSTHKRSTNVENSVQMSNSSVVDINNLDSSSACSDKKDKEDNFCYESPTNTTNNNLASESPYSRTYLRRFCFDTNDDDTDDGDSTAYECFSDDGSYDKNQPTTGNYDSSFDTACRPTQCNERNACNEDDLVKGYDPSCFQQKLSYLNHCSPAYNGINTSTNTYAWPFDEGDEDKKVDDDAYCHHQLQKMASTNDNNRNTQQNWKQGCQSAPQSNDYKSLNVPCLMTEVISNPKATRNKDNDKTNHHRTSKSWHLPFRPISKFHKRMLARSRNGERAMK